MVDAKQQFQQKIDELQTEKDKYSSDTDQYSWHIAHNEQEVWKSAKEILESQTIKTVNPHGYLVNDRFLSFEAMKGRTNSDLDDITPLYTMQLTKKVENEDGDRQIFDLEGIISLLEDKISKMEEQRMRRTRKIKKYYRPKYFKLSELAHPQIIKSIGVYNTWMRLDALCLMDVDTIRRLWHIEHGTGVYCNRLDVGLDSRGLRPPNDPDGSFYSTHKEGNTFDLEPVNGMHKEFYLFCADLINKGKLKAFNTMEDRSFTPTLSHLSRMNHNKKLLIIKP